MGKQVPEFDETKIIEGCRKGDRLAQRALFEKYKKRLYALCLRYLGDQMEAEDVLMKSFMKIFEGIKQYQGIGSFEGWMKRITIREALQFIRQHKNMFIERGDDEILSQSLVYSDVKMETNELLELIKTLPQGYRTVFNLYAIEGFTHPEIGEMLGISENTSKSQLSRARQLLQHQINEANNRTNNTIFI